MFASFPKDFNGVHIHFVGIKGTGMVALVEILTAQGAIISGSDVSERFYTDEILEKLNIKPLEFSKSNITDDIQLVVYSSAYSKSSNPDLIEAENKKIPMMLYSEALGLISQKSFSCGVCGVHGKTSTTGLVGTLLKHLDLPAQVLAGSIISSFDNSCTMTSPLISNDLSNNRQKYFVAETCEYQRHFMAFYPKKIILTSVESDHQDYYPTYDDILSAFVDYICKLPKNGQLIYCADDNGAVEAAKKALEKRPDIILIPYGQKASGDYKVTFKSIKDGKHYFYIDSLGECAIVVPGNHNILNATAAIALTIELLKEDKKNLEDYTNSIKKALLNFKGGKRRSEILGFRKNSYGQNIIFIDDYGHHPTAIKTTLSGFREFYKNHMIIVDFMSHTYTRTEALLEDFASCFDSADKVIINKIYGSARENFNNSKVSGELLAEITKKYHKDVVYAAEFEDAVAIAKKYLSEDNTKNYPEGYIFVTMGAGDNWKVGTMLLENLK
ncbi:MAG: UDP-N-acetylmuramate--L-alanine ligase [Treponema sp.]|nr:UDP-N-acetylmuramate--L-alanine ligase [Treponema sp.]